MIIHLQKEVYFLNQALNHLIAGGHAKVRVAIHNDGVHEVLAYEWGSKVYVRNIHANSVSASICELPDIHLRNFLDEDSRWREMYQRDFNAEYEYLDNLLNDDTIPSNLEIGERFLSEGLYQIVFEPVLKR